MPFKIELINEKSFEISEDQTILQASLNAGIAHYHACGGKARCSTCRIVVQDGEEKLSVPNKAELKLKKQKHYKKKQL